MLLQAGLLAAALLQPAAGHFQLLFPPARGFDEDQLAKFPCGGQDRVAAAGSRTPFPLAGGPVQLDMGHTAARVQVLLAAGASPGANFSIELVPTLQEQGPRRFCLRGVSVPAGAGLKAGDVGTIQVVTNGDPDGGLYNCADVVFTDTPLDYQNNCKTDDGVKIAQSNIGGNANGTSPDAATTSASSTASSTAAARSSSSSAAAAPRATMVAAVVGVAGLLAGLAGV